MAESTPAAAAPEKGPVRKGKKPRSGKKEKKNIPHAVATVQASFNNTIIAIADQEGNVLAWSSAGRIGFKGSRKGTPFAAQLAAANCAEHAKESGVRSVDVRVTGPGAGSHGHSRRYPRSAQRLSPEEKKESLVRGPESEVLCRVTWDPALRTVCKPALRSQPGGRT